MNKASVTFIWKIVKKLPINFNIHNNVELEEFFNLKPNKRFHTKFSIPGKYGYAPQILDPKPKFHSVMTLLLKRKFNIDLKQKNFLYKIYVAELNRDVFLHVNIRIFQPNICSLTVRLNEFSTPETSNAKNLTDYQRLHKINIIREIVKRIFKMIEYPEWALSLIDDPERELAESVDIHHSSESFMYLPLLHLNGICMPNDLSQHFEKNKSEYIGILIRNDNYENTGDDIPEQIVQNNYGINKKSSESEKMLINKQGILYLTSAGITNRTYSRTRVHNLFETGLIFREFFSIFHRFRKIDENFADFLMYKILPWIECSGAIFTQSYSSHELWKLIKKELNLTEIKERMVNKDVKEAIEHKSNLFNEFGDTKWWEQADFSDIIYKQHKKLEESRKLSYLGLMASSVAHELNQPIGIIRTATSAAKDDIEDKLFRSDDIETYIDRIWKQTERLDAIINNFRRFARGDRTQCEKLNINSVIEETVALFEEQFRHRNIGFIKKICQKPVPQVWANPFQLEEVMVNLLTNARDAVEGIKNATVWIKSWCDEKEAGFRVEDNGFGIAREHRPYLFIPFFSTKSTEHSMGMGLYISHKIIEELGGRLECEDKIKGGACFVVGLPSYNQRK